MPGSDHELLVASISKHEVVQGIQQYIGLGLVAPYPSLHPGAKSALDHSGPQTTGYTSEEGDEIVVLARV